MALLAWSLPSVFMNSVLYNRLFSSGDSRTAVLLAAIGALLNVGLNLALIPSHGGAGAALATVISYWVVAPAAAGLSPSRAVGVSALRSLVRPAVAAVSGLLVAVLLAGGPVVSGLGFLAVYGAVLLAARELGPREIALLKIAVGRRAG
jgi:peptidoglycan biosynthesis protein MviN/MurJ (putative lipid II flippase)